jgi:hypothetical protein
MLAIFFMNFSRILADFQADGFPRLVFIRKCWIIDGPLSMLPKIPTYTFINFQEIFPPICLFSPIFLLVFEEISYFYLDLSSIWNSRVVQAYYIMLTQGRRNSWLIGSNWPIKFSCQLQWQLNHVWNTYLFDLNGSNWNSHSELASSKGQLIS